MFKTAQKTNPFPGLRPFQESEQHLFFGRESQIDAMVDKLAANRFLAVVGTSGSGKSSLVNCGLRPALRTGLMAEAGTAWRMAQCHPGGDPVSALSNALAGEGVLFTDYQDAGMSLPEIVDTTLRMGKLGLVDIVEQTQLPVGTNLLLVIDQFEELFRYRHLDEHGEDKSTEIGQQATAFVNLLLAAIKQSTLPVYVVITMRSDFLGDCAQFPGLAEAINNGQYLVPRMTREQRRAAIAGPIGVGGAKIYPALLTRLVNDVGTDPDQLSILQHALNRTWSYWENERGRQGMLDIECYDSIGSMTGALDKHANQAFSELDSDNKQRICETIFKALTDKASDARGVRRPTRLKTLCEMCDATSTDVVSVIDVFRKSSRSFLMPPEGVELHADTVIDISHESLMRVWKKLDHWADEEADAARMYQRLAETSELYKQENSLLRDPDLRMALKWKEQNKPNAIWANQYNSDFDGAMTFLKQSEKSDVMRKRLRAGSIAAVLFVLSGYFAYASYDTITDLSAQKDQALVELDKAEQEKIDALNEVEQAKNEVMDLVEVNTQQAVVDVEENLTRILTDEVEHMRQAAAQVETETQTTTVVAKEQIQFFNAISSLDATLQETIVKHFAQLEADRTEMQSEYTEALARYQNLNVQKKIQCEVYSLGGQSEQSLNQLYVTHCSQNVSDDSLLNNLDDNGVAGDTCEPGNFPENMLATLALQQRNFVESRNRQLVCSVEDIREKIDGLDSGSASLQLEIDRLRSTAIEAVDTIRLTDSVENVPVEPIAVPVDSSNNETAKAASQIQDLPDQQGTPDAQQTFLKRFQACENVEKLEPSGCKSENESFLPGKVFVFARVVTRIDDENLTLRWLKNGNDEPIDEKQFTVKPNPEGYRTYTWKSLDKGAYSACMFNQSDQELGCISISVGIDNSVTVAEMEPTTGTLADSELQIADAAESTLGTDTSDAEMPVSSAIKVDQNSTQDHNTAWETTRLEDSEEDGFVVCKEVNKLQPVQCSSELDPGRVYAFARIVTPHDQEIITLKWFRDGVEIPELRKKLEIKKNSSGYRTYSWNTFDTGSYEVSLSDEMDEELRKIPFNIK